MFVRIYFDEETVTEEEADGLEALMESLSSAGCQVGISDPPDTYVLVRASEDMLASLVITFPLKETKVLITEVITLEWSEQPIDPESGEVEQVLSELLDMGLPIIKHAWPQTPKQGFYRDKNHLHGVVYLHSKEVESRIRLVVRVEGLTATAALQFYADILAGNIQPLTQWNDTCDYEWGAIAEVPVSV